MAKGKVRIGAWGRLRDARSRCVSCGRESPLWMRRCPYCGEAAVPPEGLRLLRPGVTAAPFAGLPFLLAGGGPPDFGRLGRRLIEAPPAAAACLALGALLLLLPPDDADLPFPDVRELAGCQASTLARRVLAAASALAAAAAGPGPAILAMPGWVVLLAGWALWPLVWRMGAGFLPGLAVWCAGLWMAGI